VGNENGVRIHPWDRSPRSVPGCAVFVPHTGDAGAQQEKSGVRLIYLQSFVLHDVDGRHPKRRLIRTEAILPTLQWRLVLGLRAVKSMHDQFEGPGSFALEDVRGR